MLLGRFGQLLHLRMQGEEIHTASDVLSTFCGDSNHPQSSEMKLLGQMVAGNVTRSTDEDLT